MNATSNMEEQDIQIVNVNDNSKYDELLDAYARLQADFDNYRKYIDREKLRIQTCASLDAVTGLLPIIDDVERACEMSSDSEGFSLIYSKLQSFLRELGVADFGNEGETFDSDKHNAVMITSDGSVEKGCISKVLRRGYVLEDVIVRHAQVAVER